MTRLCRCFDNTASALRQSARRSEVWALLDVLRGGREGPSVAEDTYSPWAVAVRALTSIRLIDGGDTVDVRFEAADGRMIAVLIPRAAFA